jgi:ribosomal protein S18 acetylase RimI-like enzyme
MKAFRIEPLSEGDRGWVRSLLRERWGDARVVSRGRVHQADQLPGFVAMRGNTPVGLATYCVEGDACEITSLDSLIEGAGIGSALIGAVKEAASIAGCRRLWLITTNDNTHALRFYQRRGFVLAALHRNALEESRRLKPEIPLLGMDGIPLRDEIELEMVLK